MKPLEIHRAKPRAIETALGGAARGIVHTDDAPELELPPIATLPREHPSWRHDLPEVSTRAVALFKRMAPIVVTLLGFWDHAVRCLQFEHQRLLIDASGSYRLE